MRSHSSVYVRRLVLIAVCLLGGFTLLCISGWSLVMNASPSDTTLVTVLRWIPITLGVVTVLAGFSCSICQCQKTRKIFFLGMMQTAPSRKWTVNSRYEKASCPARVRRLSFLGARPISWAHERL